MLLGSTEWAETHADELKQKAVALYQFAMAMRAACWVSAAARISSIWSTGVAEGITDPETGVSVGAALRAQSRLEAVEARRPDKDHAKADAKLAADPRRRTFRSRRWVRAPISPRFCSIWDWRARFRLWRRRHSGNGVYHSRYDTFEHHSRFVDPGICL